MTISFAPRVALSTIRLESRTRKDYGDVDALAQSIQRVGLLHPIVLDSQSKLIVGERRLRACQQLGWTDIPATMAETFDDIERALYAERDENVERKPWTPSEAVEMAAKLVPYEERAAAERQYEGQARGGKSAGRGRKQTTEDSSGKTLPKAKRDETACTTARIAKAVGLSRPTLEKAQAVVQAAQDDPERFEPLAQQMDQTGKVDGAYRKLRKTQQLDQLRQREAAPGPPGGLYDVIVVDPPWPVAVQGREVRPQQIGLAYQAMTVEEIYALELPTAAQCHVWLWTTQRFLPEAFACLQRWGLTYHCCFVWHKPGGMQPMNLPQFNCEFAVYATKGSPPFVETTDFLTCFQAPRHEHSAKPEAFYTLVARVTAGRRLDLFARRAIQGFDAWGCEAP
jgi:N6-adenosine-specific RNA methylase IME4